MLLKFRVHPIGIVADIEKAYLHISVVEEQDFLRILYCDDIYKTIPQIVPYRFCRVIFGATCSQFLLNGTIRKHAEKFEEMDPEFARKVNSDFYVDNLTTRVSSTEGVDLYKKVRIRFMEANFNVRKWRTNDLALRNLINDSKKDPSNNEKVLGISWDNQEDKLILGVSEIFVKAENVNPTKRNILRVIASIYDPVGYLAPIVINLKLLFQEICHVGIKWDEHIGSLETKWLHIIDLLKISKNLCVDRCYFVRDIKDPVQYFILHGFSDASNNAYCAVIYLQTITRSGNVNLSFVTAKLRVTPLK